MTNQIKSITDGLGVDVVLNMLAGDAIQKGINSLAPNGRYLELAVHALKNSSALNLSGLTQNQSIYSIDLRRLMASDDEINSNEIFDVMNSLIESKQLVPVVSKIYPINKIKSALSYVAQGRHIGKVVVSHTAKEVVDCTNDCLTNIFKSAKSLSKSI